MNYAFERALLRLKEAAGARTDKELAGLFGMDASAFNKRKVRGSFPERELYALAAKRPDLKLDVPYILSGDRSAPQPAAPGFPAAAAKPRRPRPAKPVQRGYCSAQQIGQRLRQVRGAISQREFAARLGISPSALRRHESGQCLPGADLLIQLWQTHRVQPTWVLLGDAPEGAFVQAAQAKRAAAQARRRDDDLDQIFFGDARAAGEGAE